VTHLDLFSGIGGFAIAAQNCGYTTIGFCEKEPYAQQILKERFGAVLADAASEQDNGERGDCKCGRDAVGRNQQAAWCRNGQADNNCAGRRNPILHDNIFTLDGSDYAGVDLLTGGFPCQPFSVAGKRKGAADDRALWPEMLRVIQEARPAWIIGENVSGLITMELDSVLSDLEASGYEVECFHLGACSVDARHRRMRVWIVAHAISLLESQSSGSIADERRRISHESEAVAHADEPGSQGRHGAELRERGGERIAGQGGSFCAWPAESDWFPQSPICRVAHGIPNRAHRLRGLGNAICPQVCEEILRAICSIEGGAK